MSQTWGLSRKDLEGALSKLTLKKLSLLSAFAFAACGNQPTGAGKSASVGAESDAVIGNSPASTALLQATGSIGTLNAEGRFEFKCTASLIGEKAVVTAKHCLQTSTGWLHAEQKTYFALGNALQPTRLVQIVEAKLPALTSGGYSENGSDVAALNLIEAITDVAPLKLAPNSLETRHLKRKFLTAGFGAKSDAELNGSAVSNGERSAGTVAARGLQGKTWEFVFGSFDGFKQFIIDSYGQEEWDEWGTWWTDLFEQSTLLEGYEAFFGGQDADARLTSGDAGGPLLLQERTPQGVNTFLYGVFSESFYTEEKFYGSFFALFGPEARKAIEKAQAWVDPCITEQGMESVNGHCEGAVAVRCTDIAEGPRSLSKVDCAELDLVCVVGERGAVGCGELQEPPPSE